ncbi:MAG: hypothetical protein ACREPM_11290 [Gemmatimonadaceae bacterium]
MTRSIRLVRAASRARARLAVLAVALLVACAHNTQSNMEADDDPPREPIRVHVRNENFLDMNIAVVSSGVARRLGQVPGNSVGDFTVEFNLANGQSISISATPIGGSGRYQSPGLSLGSGQLVDVRIASTLRQSSTVVREP